MRRFYKPFIQYACIFDIAAAAQACAKVVSRTDMLYMFLGLVSSSVPINASERVIFLSCYRRGAAAIYVRTYVYVCTRLRCSRSRAAVGRQQTV